MGPAPASEVTLPAIFADNMVLQREQPIPIWGTGSPGGLVRVRLGEVGSETTCDDTGRWKLDLPAQTAGGPHELTIQGSASITFKNVMVGEVWVCSGQSNMEMPLSGWGQINNYEEEISAATFPRVRLFHVNHTMSTRPLDNVSAISWQECSPKTIPNFSAVAYFFGRKLLAELDVPIGLIHTSWGGTPAEAWTEAEFLKKIPAYRPIVEQMQNSGEMAITEYEDQLAEWNAMVDERFAQKVGSGPAWSSPELDDDSWETITLPSLWEDAGLPGMDGIVWFRRSLKIPATSVGKDLKLLLGPIDDNDTTFFNGEQIGTTSGYNIPREYTIPSRLVRAGENTVAVKVTDTGGGGGIYGAPEQLALQTAEGASIPLAGSWRYQVGIDLSEIPPAPQSPENPHRPTVLYNAMLHPLMPFGIRGAIWYQGESNVSRAYQYRQLFKTMIESWRKQWGQGDFPFLFVQLANYLKTNPIPGDSDWAELREAQLMALSLPNTGMAVAIDIGDADDIHPKNKQDVGLRLALNALATVYGSELVYSGPLFRSMEIEGSKVTLKFDHVGGGLTTRNDKPLKGFTIAGEDQDFVWADAKIEGDTVVVSNRKVRNPVAVRYGWAANPDCNLYNAEGLPASPFRTDDWKGITQETN